MGRLLVLAVVLCLVVLATEARAGTVTIEYQITSGSAPSGFFDGAITGGQFRVKYQAAGSNTVLSGPAILETFTVRATRLSSYESLAQTIQLTLLAPILGQGAPGSVFRAGGGDFSGYSILHCLRPYLCNDYDIPLSVAYYFPSLRFYPDAVGGISITGPSGSAAGMYQTPGSPPDYPPFQGSLSIQFTGTEVNRTFVPEPVGGALLPGAVVTLVALRRLAGARRRRGEFAPPASYG